MMQETIQSGRAISRPPSRLEDGTTNPVYTRWYRQQKPESYQAYNASPAARAARLKYAATQRAKDKARLRQRNRITGTESTERILRGDAST
jgi:hypothetical protein